ncbi:restriction endonuclease subunit S [Jeotgalibaca ciconiae]|uniref:Restriction endonuclease subunit S n=1 Tax=Jeotgalibaca ciconiae TaxID=2496265 RepID=A0A3Q9BJI4_9LACT|nr:restriction endonuclease subunit S [Jeotgalibaca ciconiae]AZP03770.1 restriction endonuclease subunit S [Jeotgalibaca ciconiae]
MTKRVPEIRFEGFTDDWEQRKLGEVAKIIDPHPSHRAPIAVIKGIPFIGIGDVDEDGNINYKSSRLVDEKIYDEHHKRYDLSKNSIGIGRVASLGKVIRLRNDIGKYAVSPTMAVIQFHENSYNDFMYATMSNPEFQKQFKSLSNGSTRQSVGMQDLRVLEIQLPNNINEQKKIGAFFKNLDHTIALHQRKLEQLQSIKDGFLQKLFPKDGEKEPEIRFLGFADDWEQRKLGELSEISRGASPRPIQDPKWFDKDSDIGWLRIADVTEQNGRITQLEQKISNLAEEKTRVLLTPHLLLSIAATVGKPVINYVKTGVHDGFLIFYKPQFDQEFMFQWLEMFRPKWQKYGQPGSQVNLNSELVKNQEILLPSLDEQIKISTFFKTLDDAIALHQRELELLKQSKKAFLQKMFV